MFTGIVRELGTVARRERAGELVRLTIDAPKTAELVQPLESVAVNGVCLTAARVGGGLMTFEAVKETLARTTLGALRPGDRVNLEPSLRLVDRLHGHVVFGHVDGTGVVVGSQRKPGAWTIDVRVDRAMRAYLVPKGPVTVEGVSLTVGNIQGNMFTLHLIPETLRRTTLESVTRGQRLNLEVDYLAKLVRQFCMTT